MEGFRRHIAPLVAALLLVACTAVPLAHRWLHHGVEAHHPGVTLVAADTHCDLCAAGFTTPPPPAPTVLAALVPDAPAPVVVFDTGVARLLEAIGRAPPLG